MAKRTTKQPRPQHKWWWVRHGRTGHVQHGVSMGSFLIHHPVRKKKRHLGMTMPVALYPTTDHLPVYRELIPIWTDEEMRKHTQQGVAK